MPSSFIEKAGERNEISEEGDVAVIERVSLLLSVRRAMPWSRPVDD